METKILTSLAQMLEQFEIIQFLYPNLTKDKYAEHLKEMIPHNYNQAAIFKNDKCIGLTGFWTAPKIWTGTYIEIDNFIVHPNHRKKGIAQLLCQEVDKQAEKVNANCIVLDAFTGNFVAHKVYYNQGYEPRGFHFVKTINKDGFA
jgi:GNAT superfamily N-acetyltransferase